MELDDDKKTVSVKRYVEHDNQLWYITAQNSNNSEFYTVIISSYDRQNVLSWEFNGLGNLDGGWARQTTNTSEGRNRGNTYYVLTGKPAWNQTKWGLVSPPSQPGGLPSAGGEQSNLLRSSYDKSGQLTSGSSQQFNIISWELPEYLVDVQGQVHPVKVVLTKQTALDNKPKWHFEWVQESYLPPPTFQSIYFPITADQVAVKTNDKYDIIIVGSGIGGGVLAQDLYHTNFKLGPKKAKRVLLLERGDLRFHSHCFNAARPSGSSALGRQNDTFFETFRSHFATGPAATDWSGGPMYNLGGRSAAWGLFVPRIYENTLKEKFPAAVSNDLLSGYYDAAERLMGLSMPKTKTIHQYVMDRLNIDWTNTASESKTQWQWGRIASEFQDERNYDFAQGAYSTIDSLLEIAMTQQKNANGAFSQLNHFQTVLGANVHSLTFDKMNPPRVTGVNVLTEKGKRAHIQLAHGGSVVLAAGSVDSPAILLRSERKFNHTENIPEGLGNGQGMGAETMEGAENNEYARGSDKGTRSKPIEMHKKILENGGLHLTDHDLLVFGSSFRYRNPKDRTEFGSLKLQTYLDLGSRVALANMAVDASLFLPRGEFTQNDDLPKFIMVFLLELPLQDKVAIRLNAEKEPEIISPVHGTPPTSAEMTILKNLTVSTMESLENSMGIEFIVDKKDVVLSTLGAGAVAHEVGSLPMMAKDPKSQKYCLDENLQIIPEICSGVYVCDNSCFPHSPHANPSLTLAALAIRLSEQLNPPYDAQIDGIVPPSDVKVMNQSGWVVRVTVSNVGLVRSDASDEEVRKSEDTALEQVVELKAGELAVWRRKAGIAESLFVYKLDRASETKSFLTQPVLVPAQPGELTLIT